MVYGYARVSTKGQAKDGNSLADQENKLRNAGAEVVFADAFTGTKKDRPELDKLMSVIKPGDTLIVTKLDRVARSIKYGAELIEELMNKDIKVNILNLGVLDNSPNGKLMRNIFLAFAEFERDMIVERTTEGKNIARLREDYQEGRPMKKYANESEYFMQYYRKEITLEEGGKLLGYSHQTFKNHYYKWLSSNKEI